VRRRPALRIGGLVLTGLIALVIVAIVVSAATGRPSKAANADTIVDAPKQAVWATLVDLGAYDEWNPVITSARGVVAEGAGLDLRFERGGEPAQGVEVELVIVRDERKLRWMYRLLVPGLRDVELEILLEPDGADRTHVRASERYEGLLAPLVPIAERRRDLEAIVEALETQVERS
jgi:hypothetical protein